MPPKVTKKEAKFAEHLALAKTAEEEHDDVQALKHYQLCYEVNSNNQETKSKYLSYFKKHFENENNKKTQDELKIIGNDFVAKQKFNEAIVAYTAAIDLDPSVESAAAIYSNRCLCYYNLASFQEAHDDGTMASILRPEWFRGWLRRATTAVALKKWEDASEAYDKYFELDPEGSSVDAEANRNRTTVKRKVEELVAERKGLEERLNRIRGEITACDDDEKRRAHATKVLVESNGTSSFDLDAARLALEYCRLEFLYTQDELKKLKKNVKFYRDHNSPLLLLLDSRLNYKFHSVNTPKLDELIRSVIDKMAEQKVEFPPKAMVLACYPSVEGTNIRPNPNIILALLHTGKVDPNAKGDPNLPLNVLVECANEPTPDDQVHPDVMASLHALLNWPGIDVNSMKSNNPDLAVSPLMTCEHPEVARLLIRHGADVNAEGHCVDANYGYRLRSNALSVNSTLYNNPRQAEMIRTLISSGAKLIADGRDGKSSRTMFDAVKKRWDDYIPYESLDLLLQLNKNQGLEMRYCSPSHENETMPLDHSFLLLAIMDRAPLRTIELLCHMDPASVNGERDHVTPMENVGVKVGRRGVPESIATFKILIDHGANLDARSRSGTAFYGMCRFWKGEVPREVFQIIRNKFGEAEMKKRMAEYRRVEKPNIMYI